MRLGPVKGAEAAFWGRNAAAGEGSPSPAEAGEVEGGLYDLSWEGDDEVAGSGGSAASVL